MTKAQAAQRSRVVVSRLNDVDTMTVTITLPNVDLALLQKQAVRLSEIQRYLTTGEVFSTADAWPEALEGILNLFANMGLWYTPSGRNATIAAD